MSNSNYGDLVATHDALKERKSYHAYTKKFPDIKMERAHTRFQTAVQEAMDATGGSEKETKAAAYIKELWDELHSQTDELEGMAKRKNGAWVLKKEYEDDADKFAELLEKHEKTQGRFTDLMRGKEVKNHKAPKKVVKAFEEMESAIGSADGIMNGWLGRARVDGLDKAVKNSLKEMQFWNDKNKKNRGIGFTKCTVAAGGAAVIAHGALADKSSDGEERNGLVRLGEVVLGAGAIAGALAFGKAR